MSGIAVRPKRNDVVLPDGWNDGLRAALGQLGSRTVGILCDGDSFTQGAGASDIMANSWPSKLRAGLLARNLLLGGDFYPCIAADDLFIQSGSSYRYGPTAPPWVVNATNRSYFSGVFGDFPMYTDTAVAGKLVFTDPDARPEHDILLLNYAVLTGAWTWNLDGGADQAVNTVAGQIFSKVALPSASNAAHVVNIGNQSTSQRMFIAGMLAYKQRGSGLLFANVGHVGRALSALTPLGATSIPTDLILPAAGWNGTDYTLGFPAAADLFIHAYGINDCQATPATTRGGVLSFKRTLVRYVRAVRRGNPNAAIILVVNNHPDQQYSEATGTINNTLDWPLYVETIYQVAREYRCALVNFYARWGEKSVTNGYQTSGDFHPTDAGHADIANLILSIL